MTALFNALPWLLQLRHRHMRRRLVEKSLRHVTSRSKALRLSNYIP